MRDLAVLFLHLVTTIVRLAGPGGAGSVVAESVLIKHQLLILNRSRKRSPNLRLSDRLVVAWCALLMPVPADPFHDRPQALHLVQAPPSPDRAEVSAALLVTWRDQTGPKGTQPGSGRRRRRDETAKSDLGMPADRTTDSVGLRCDHKQGCGAANSCGSVPPGTRCGRAVLAHGPRSHEGQLWSLDLFRCESAVKRSHWALVVMDQWTRRIVGFGVHRGVVDGVGLCRMFNRATQGHTPPRYLSADHDPLYRFHQWQANLRILDVKEIKTVPYVPLSHPVVERLIGTLNRIRPNRRYVTPTI